MSEFKPERQLQIYGQYIWHSDARLCGTIDGLTALRNAINSAIVSGMPQEEAFFASDGEGYLVYVVPMTEQALDRDPCWYTDDMANPWRFERMRELQQRVFELEAALRKVRLHNREEK